MKRFAAITALLFGLSCTQQPVGPQEYLQYVDDPANGLIAGTEIGELTFALQYRPAAYEAIRAAGEEQLTAETFKELLQEQEGLQYYVFRIGAKQKGTDVLAIGTNASSALYQERIAYLGSSFMDDVKLVDGDDTLDCRIHHWERTYHLGDHQAILLGFDTIAGDKEKTKILICNDRLFGVGKVQLRIREQDIRKIPDLSF